MNLPTLSLQKEKRNALLIALALCALQLLFRSLDLASDGNTRLGLVESGDITNAQFSGWGHFLQVPLAHYFYAWGQPFISARFAFIFWGIFGNFLSFVFLYLALFDRMKSEGVARLTVLTLALTPLSWFYWNGETPNLALGFAFVAFYAAQRKLSFPSISIFLALSALCRIDFALMAPGLVWLRGDYELTRKDFLRFFAGCATLTAITTLFIALILGTTLFAMGVIDFSLESLRAYNKLSFTITDGFMMPYSTLLTLKSFKGILVSLIPALYSFTELIHGSELRRGIQLLYGAYALFSMALLLAGTFLLAREARKNRELVSDLAAIFLLIAPIQILFNWRYSYQTEEYHAGSLVGLMLAVAWAFTLANRSPKARLLSRAFFTLFALGFFFLYALPARQFPLDQQKAQHSLQAIRSLSNQPIQLLVCDSEIPALQGTEQIPLLRLAADWPADQIAARIAELARRSLTDGARVFITGRKCNLRYLTRSAGPYRLLAENLGKIDFGTLGFELQPVPRAVIPLNWYNQYDPASWRYAELLEFIPR